jgi:hypothetical protein
MIHRIKETSFKGVKTAFELWFTKASSVTVVMLRGAYWQGERRRLLLQLGTSTFEQLRTGKSEVERMAQIAEQIHRLDDKLIAEETLVNEICFGAPEPEELK